MLHPSDFSPRFPPAADAPDNAETGAKEFGSRLGPYEVVSLLGAGGMGEVYRARDTKLNRDVALKILPDAFAIDGDRIARFRREAQVLASLNHPNIAAIYGFEDSGSAHALVLELVDGPTLADRIAKGAIPFDDAQIEVRNRYTSSRQRSRRGSRVALWFPPAASLRAPPNRCHAGKHAVSIVSFRGLQC